MPLSTVIITPDAGGTPVHVDMFADRIEITNPGGLFGAVTKRTLKQPASGSTRNPFLFSLLAVPYLSDRMVCRTTLRLSVASRPCCAISNATCANR